MHTYRGKGHNEAFFPGMVIATASSKEPPGWRLCYGQAVPRTGETAELFAAIGTTYGAGDGSTTFNLPDARGCVVAGRDGMGDVEAGRLTGAHALGALIGTQTDTTLSFNIATDISNGGSSTVLTGIGTGASTVQPTLVLNLLIKL